MTVWAADDQIVHGIALIVLPSLAQHMKTDDQPRGNFVSAVDDSAQRFAPVLGGKLRQKAHVTQVQAQNGNILRILYILYVLYFLLYQHPSYMFSYIFHMICICPHQIYTCILKIC